MQCLYLIILGVAAGMRDSHACAFVGLRFAHTASLCVEGVCDAIFRRPDGVFTPLASEDTVPVTCQTAQKLGQHFLEPYRVGSDWSRLEPARRTSEQIGAIETFVLTRILQAVELMALGGNPWNEGLASDFREFDELLLRTAAFDWGAWTTFIAPSLRESRSLINLRGYLEGLVQMSIFRSYLEIEQRKGFRAATYLLADLGALLGVVFIPASVRPYLQWYLVNAPHTARNPSLFEYQPPQRDLTRASEWVVALSYEIAELSSPTANAWNLQKLTEFFSVLEQYTTTEALVVGQIVDQLCPTLSEVIRRIGHGNGAHEVETCVTLIDLCTSAGWNMFGSTEALASLILSDVAPMDIPDQEQDIVHFFATVSLGWSRGLQGSRSEQHDAAAWLLHSFVANECQVFTSEACGVYFLRGDMRVAIGFGRALGFAIRYGVDFSFLKFDESIAKALHPHFRLQFSSTEELTRYIGATTRQAIDSFFWLTLGLQDTLGPGGFESYTPSRWIGLFAPP